MTPDTLADLGVTFLGSRMKRLADRLQADAAATLQALDLPIQPAQQQFLAVLRRQGPQTVGGVAQHLRLSQPTATRAIQALIEQGLIDVSREGRDQRQKVLSLSPGGEALMDRLERELWPRVEAAAMTRSRSDRRSSSASIIAISSSRAARCCSRRPRTWAWWGPARSCG